MPEYSPRGAEGGDWGDGGLHWSNKDLDKQWTDGWPYV